MRRFAQALSVLALMIGLVAGVTLMAAPQKAPKQTSKPVTRKAPKQTNKPATALNQNLYKQQSRMLKIQIKDDQKRLKSNQRQYGKEHPTVKADRQQLQKNEKALKQLQKDHNKGSGK
jgi:heme-binding NEAT domain protein